MFKFDSQGLLLVEFFKLCSLLCQSIFWGKAVSGSGSLSRHGNEEFFPSPHPYCLLWVNQASGPGTEKRWGQASRQHIGNFIGERSAWVSNDVSFRKRKNYTVTITHMFTPMDACICMCIYIFIYVCRYVYIHIILTTTILLCVPWPDICICILYVCAFRHLHCQRSTLGKIHKCKIQLKRLGQKYCRNQYHKYSISLFPVISLLTHI